MDFYPIDATNIRLARENKGISINQCSKDLNIPYGVLQAIETGRKSTIASRAIIIAEYFNLPVGELFSPTYYRAKVT
ncbi:helix-turn-helix domain-containing protein [Bacillus toyonensis]|uniref:helix-turn-helix domain-containing protein n=1 Tax=Bacillus wiedmannii TaxID=1890302 RepID=UPI000BF232D7|nr:helix-turn-helix transcriptional regulator [Bacillus wiedmannii]MDP1459982.1 helix-turn-helix transcriptional regulator [Bacillus wiedmannii]PEO38435.1 transcriptional regulator [Bacillus wiedmannii]